MRFLLAAAAFAAALPARSDDLAAAIPANAKAIVFVNNPMRFAEKLEKLAADSGAPPFPQSLTEKLKEALPDGVADLKRPMAFVALGFDGEQQVAFVATAANAASPLAKAGGKDLGDGVQEVELHGHPTFLLARNGLVIAAPKAETLAAFRKPGKGLADLLEGDAAAVAGKADAFAILNVPASVEDLSGKLDEAERMIGGAGEAVPKQTADQFRVMAGAGRALLRDGARAYVAVEIDDSGAALRGFLDFRPDSAIGKTLAKDFGAAPSEPFVGVPDRPWMAIAFMDMARLKSAMLGMAELNAAAAKDPALAERSAALNKITTGSIAGASMMWSVEKGKFAQFQRSVLLPGADGAAVVAAAQEAMQLGIKMAGGAEQLPGFKIDVKTSKETLGGIEFARADLTMQGLPEPAAGLVEKFVGKPISTLIGVGKDGALLSLLNADPTDWLKDSSRVAENARVKASLAKLGDKPVMAMFLDPWGVMELVKEIAPIPLPPHLTTRPNPPVPPLGFSALPTKQGVELRMRYESATGRALSGQGQ